MGEDLVLFRDGRGQVGLLALHCSHRGTTLEWGAVEAVGIRCCYHGWLYDVDGRVLETPGEPPESTYKDRFCHGAYPTLEYKGLVFAYMGPPGQRPEFPVLDTFDLEGYQTLPSARDTEPYIAPCNWLQIKENCMDPIHTVYLHSRVTGDQFTPAFAEQGLLDWHETPIGMLYTHTRRVGDLVWVRISDFIPPNIHQFSPEQENIGEEEVIQERPMGTHWAVPADDTHTMVFLLRYPPIGRPQRHANPALTGQDGGNRPYEERQRQPGDWEAQTGQRAIAVHGLEHLGATDRGVIMLRKILLDGIRAVQRGEEPWRAVSPDGKPLTTYAGNSVIRIPPAPTPDADRALLQETARKVATGYYHRNPPAAVAAQRG
jgi:phenylpropionate dioxygenase-like ring-hydroxylating dioxygenase large terminal subunit